MEKLPVRFSENQTFQLKDLAESLGVSTATLARAALQIGIEKVKAVGSKDLQEAQSLTLMTDLKAKQ